MLHTVKVISPLNTYINDYFNSFKTELINYANIQWKEEDLKGKSTVQYKAMQYYNLMYFLILVYEEVVRTNNKYPYSYYNDKFKISDYKKCIECEGISFNKALQAFGLDTFFNTDGIETIGIEVNFGIE